MKNIIDIIEKKQVGHYETYERPYWRYVAHVTQTESGNVTIVLTIYRIGNNTPYRIKVLNPFEFKYEDYLIPLRNAEWTKVNKEPQYQRVNYNSTVKVKLSKEAKEIYRNLYQFNVDVDSKGFSEFQLWWLMHIFGPHILGHSSLLEDGCIYIKENDLESV